MITERHKISIQEVSFQEYESAKRKKNVKPPKEEQTRTIYGLILGDISFSIGSFCRQVEDNLNSFRRINEIMVKEKDEEKIILGRRTIYSSSEERTEKLFSSTSKLQSIIEEGRGIDLIFKGTGNPKKAEIHYYRLKGENMLLVDVQIPHFILDKGIYRFTRKTTKTDYNRLKATLS